MIKKELVRSPTFKVIYPSSISLNPREKGRARIIFHSLASTLPHDETDPLELIAEFEIVITDDFFKKFIDRLIIEAEEKYGYTIDKEKIRQEFKKLSPEEYLEGWLTDESQIR